MRWPNRTPHVLTPGMREAQRALAAFEPLVDWTRFRRRNLNEEIVSDSPAVRPFGCGDGEQAVLWLLRTDITGRDGRVRADAEAIATTLRIPGQAPGRYAVTAFDARAGEVLGTHEAVAGEGALVFETPRFAADLALAIRPA
jgi:hypothetical protein